MNTSCNFYLCPTCFATSKTQVDCHEHAMIHCSALSPGDERLKPLFDSQGDLKTRAPRWFLEELQGSLPGFNAATQPPG